MSHKRIEINFKENYSGYKSLEFINYITAWFFGFWLWFWMNKDEDEGLNNKK